MLTRAWEVPFKTEHDIVMQQQDQPYTKSFPCPSFLLIVPLLNDQRKQDDVVYLLDSINRKRKSADSHMLGYVQDKGANKSLCRCHDDQNRHSTRVYAHACGLTPGSHTFSLKPSTSVLFLPLPPSLTMELSVSCFSSASLHLDPPSSVRAPVLTWRPTPIYSGPHSSAQKAQTVAAQGPCSQGGRGPA
jgi:hypothetical protein